MSLPTPAIYLKFLRKQLVNDATTMKGKLAHVWHWKELPTGQDITVEEYDNLMAEAGALAGRLDESLAGIRGQLNARNQRAKAAKWFGQTWISLWLLDVTAMVDSHCGTFLELTMRCQSLVGFLSNIQFEIAWPKMGSCVKFKFTCENLLAMKPLQSSTLIVSCIVYIWFSQVTLHVVQSWPE